MRRVREELEERDCELQRRGEKRKRKEKVVRVWELGERRGL